MRYLVFMLCLSLISMPGAAQLYKWVDENGKTQYSDQPPPSNNIQNEQKLKINSAPASASTAKQVDNDNDDDASNAKTLAEEKLEYSKRRQERLEQKSQKEAINAENKQKCVDAQSRLKVFSESPRLRMPDGKGGLVYVDDNVRQQKINEAKEAIKAYCK